VLDGSFHLAGGKLFAYLLEKSRLILEAECDAKGQKVLRRSAFVRRRRSRLACLSPLGTRVGLDQGRRSGDRLQALQPGILEESQEQFTFIRFPLLTCLPQNEQGRFSSPLFIFVAPSCRKLIRDYSSLTLPVILKNLLFPNLTSFSPTTETFRFSSPILLPSMYNPPCFISLRTSPVELTQPASFR
jgi:hypothetical protein